MNEKEKVAVTIIVLVILAILIPSAAFWWMKRNDHYNGDRDDSGDGDVTDLERGATKKTKKTKNDDKEKRRSKSSDAARRRRRRRRQHQQHHGRRSHRYSSSGRNARKGRGRQQNWTAVEPSRSRSVNDDPSFCDFEDDIGRQARAGGGTQRRCRSEHYRSRSGRQYNGGERKGGTGGWYEQHIRDLKAQTTESTEMSDGSQQMSSTSGPPIILNVPNDAKTNLVRRSNDIIVCIDQDNTELVTVSSSMSLSGFPDGVIENAGKRSISSKTDEIKDKQNADEDMEVGRVNYPARKSFSSHPSLNKSQNSSSKVDVVDRYGPKSNHECPPYNKPRRSKTTARHIDMVGMVVEADKTMKDIIEPTQRLNKKNGQKEAIQVESKREPETMYQKTKRAPKPIPDRNRCVDVHVCPSKTCTLCQKKVDVTTSGRLKKKQQQEKISGGVQFIQAQKMETGMIKKLQSESAVRSKWWEVGESFFNLYYRAQVRAVQKQEQREREHAAAVAAEVEATQSILRDIESSREQIYGDHRRQVHGRGPRRPPPPEF